MSNTKIGAKEKIINAAWELFREKGYEETTLPVSYTHLDVYKRQVEILSVYSLLKMPSEE